MKKKTIIAEILHIADELDANNRFTEADELTEIASRLAAYSDTFDDNEDLEFGDEVPSEMDMGFMPKDPTAMKPKQPRGLFIEEDEKPTDLFEMLTQGEGLLDEGAPPVFAKKLRMKIRI